MILLIYPTKKGNTIVQLIFSETTSDEIHQLYHCKSLKTKTVNFTKCKKLISAFLATQAVQSPNFLITNIMPLAIFCAAQFGSDQVTNHNVCFLMKQLKTSILSSTCVQFLSVKSEPSGVYKYSLIFVI